MAKGQSLNRQGAEAAKEKKSFTAKAAKEPHSKGTTEGRRGHAKRGIQEELSVFLHPSDFCFLTLGSTAETPSSQRIVNKNSKAP